MQKYIIITLILLLPIKVRTQEKVISGNIYSAHEDTPVEFIHVSVKNTPQGTYTNSAGSFKLKLEEFNPGMVLVISGIGYHTKEIQLDTFPRDSLEIKIKPKKYAIGEVEFKRQRLIDDSYKILKKAFENIEKNYPSEPFVIEGYYQDIFQDYDSYKNLYTSTKLVKINSNGFDAEIQEKDIDNTWESKSDSFWSKVYYDNDNMMLPQYQFPNYGGNHILCLLRSDPVRNHKRKNISFINNFDILPVQNLSNNPDFFSSNHQFTSSPTIGNYIGKRAYFINFSINDFMWRTYLNIIDEPLINIEDGGYYIFYPSFTSGKKVWLRLGEIVIDTEDFAILKFEYHIGFLNDTYKIGIEYQKQGKLYYPVNLYLGNKCFLNPNYDFSLTPKITKGTIQCKGGIDYFNKVREKYSRYPNGGIIIKALLQKNTLLTPNTELPDYYTRDGNDITFYNEKLNKITAYSKTLEDILLIFKLKEYKKILHHRVLKVNKIYKTASDSAKDIINRGNSFSATDFNKDFKYIGDTSFTWYADLSNMDSLKPFNFKYESYLHSHKRNYGNYYSKYERQGPARKWRTNKIFNVFPIPVTSVDDNRYIYSVPKREYLTDKHYLIKGIGGFSLIRSYDHVK